MRWSLPLAAIMILAAGCAFIESPSGWLSFPRWPRAAASQRRPAEMGGVT